MIGLLVIAHAPLAGALLDCARHVYVADPGHCSRCAVLDVPADADCVDMLARARGLCRAVDAGEGVLVITDLAGATPGNVAAQLAKPGSVEVLAGANMPMLLRALTYRATLSLAALAAKAEGGGAGGIARIGCEACDDAEAPLVSTEHTTPVRVHP